MTWSRLSRSVDLNLVLVALLSVFSFAPLTYPGYFAAHSGFLPVFNLYDLEGDLWSNWGWLPRVATGHNVLSGEGGLPYLLAESLRWLGLGGPQAIKAVYLVGLVASGLGMYLLAKRLIGTTAGLLAAAIYLYLPFHLATVYVRGAFAEAWAFALYPLVLLCWERYLGTSRVSWVAFAVIVYCALASTTMGLALIFAPFVAVFVLVLGPSWQLKTRALLALAFAVSLGVLLQVPALIRYGLPASRAGDFAQHSVYPFQLLSAAWGFGASVPGWQDSMPFQLGLAATGMALVTTVLLLRAQEVSRRLLRLLGFLAVVALISVLLVTPASMLLWRASQLWLFLRYPWQLLAFTGLATSLLAGAMVCLAPRLGGLPWQAVLVTMAILSSYGYLSPQFADLEVGGSPVAELGEEVLLLAYRLEGPLRHGATVHLTLFWQGLLPMNTDYAVFVHVVDGAGAIWAQCDSMPMGGEKPTSTWTPGEIIEDEYQMAIDVEGPREGYSVQLGLYDPDTGGRLPLADGGTAVTIR